MSGNGPVYQQTHTSSRIPRALQPELWELDLPTSEPARAPGTPGPWLHPPAVQHQFWNPWALQSETTGPSATCQCADPRPRTQLHPLRGGSGTATLGPDLAHQQVDTSPRTTTAPRLPCQDPVNTPAAAPGPPPQTPCTQPCPPAGQLWDALGPSASSPGIHPHPQQANTTSTGPQSPELAMPDPARSP